MGINFEDCISDEEKKDMKNMDVNLIICPKCNTVADLKKTKYGPRYSCCDLWSWGLDSPLVDATTHEARKAAHVAFDVIWQSGLMTRSDSYYLLAEELNIPKKDCHMKLMDAETAKKVPRIASEILESLK